MIKKSGKGVERTEIKHDLSSFGMVMLVIIPFYVIIQYGYINYIQNKAENLITLVVTSSDSPEYIREGTADGGSHERYVLKAQEFNCHFWIVSESMEIVTNNKKTKELLESIQRDDKLTLVISEEEENQLGSLYFNARLFGLSKNDAILFSPGQLKTLQKDNMNSTLVVATILEFAFFIGLIWKRNQN